jgi:AcrR family transcriptional regulator
MDESRQLTDQGRERRQQLLDAAEELFTRDGYNSTRIADICRSAGVAKGLFYWYFDSKQALFVDLVRSIRLQLRRGQAAAMDPLDDPVTRIREAAVASVRFMAEHHGFFAFLDAERSDEAIAAVLREGSEIYIGDVERLVLEAQRMGQIPEDADTRLLAVGVLGAVSHFAGFHRSGRLDLPVDRLAAFVGDWVVGALSAANSPTKNG